MISNFDKILSSKLSVHPGLWSSNSNADMALLDWLMYDIKVVDELYRALSRPS